MDLRSIAPPGQSDAVDMLLSYGSNRHHPTADPNMGDTSLQAKKQHRKFIAACHRTGLPKGSAYKAAVLSFSDISCTSDIKLSAAAIHAFIFRIPFGLARTLQMAGR